MGLAALALEGNPVFPTYPNRMPTADVTAGLVLPNAAVALLGKGGAGATLLLIFMAVTSATSAELIAVSSIWTYDIYQTYINPNVSIPFSQLSISPISPFPPQLLVLVPFLRSGAYHQINQASGKLLVGMSHTSCVVYAIIMAAFSTGLFYAGISMGWLYLFMGVLISSAVLPASLTLLWADQNWIAAAASPVLGLVVSLTAWLVTAKRECGELTVECTGSNYPMLAGNVAALLSPVVFVPILTYAFGRQKYDWISMKAIRLGDDSDITKAAHIDLELTPGGERVIQDAEADEAEQSKLKRAAIIARTTTVIMTLILLVLWPMPLYGSGYIFSKPFFTGWVTVGILWLFGSTACVGIFPLWQGRKTMAHTVKSMYLDMRGKYHPTLVGREGVITGEKAEGSGGTDTPEEKVVVKTG